MPSITCPKCGRTSYNRNDVRHGYCTNCHDWTAQAPALGMLLYCHYCFAMHYTTEPHVFQNRG